MDRIAYIRQALRTFASEVGPRATMLAQVRSVDKANATCVLFDADTNLEYYDVRLRPVLDGKESFTILPKVDTWVLASRIEGYEDWMLIACGEADIWRYQVGNATVEQNATGLLIQNQQDTLRQALELIVQAVQKIVVVQGQNPDYVKLQQALTKIQNVLR